VPTKSTIEKPTEVISENESAEKPTKILEGEIDTSTNGSEEVKVREQDVEKPRSARKSKVEEQAEDVAKKTKAQEAKERKAEIEKHRKALEALSPSSDPVEWHIGRTPEYGGKEKHYSIYVQDKLPWMARQKFFALLSRTFSQAIKASGGSVGGMGDIFGSDEGGSLIERGRRLTQRDFMDASSFMTLAFELVGYSPDFLVECYVLWLNVPRVERSWARERFNEPWDPEKELWGLKDEDHERLIEIFIDQNYEDIRDFFAVRLPKLAQRVAAHEKAKDRNRDQESESDLSKS
jgi:hypothetical protein